MKNNTFIILTFLVVLGTASNAFAGDIWKNMPHYPYSGAGRTHTNVVSTGMVSYAKEGGVQTTTIMGEVKSINSEKGLFVLENKHDGITTTVSTDAQTITSLHPGDMATVKLHSGSPVAYSVATGSRARSNNAAPMGMITYNKGSKIITGEVVSINSNKRVFVVEDRRDKVTVTVLTDSETIASLRPGQIVTVKLPIGSPIAESVAIGN